MGDGRQLLQVTRRVQRADVDAFGKPHIEAVQEQRIVLLAERKSLDLGRVTHEWGEGVLVSWAYAQPSA